MNWTRVSQENIACRNRRFVKPGKNAQRTIKESVRAVRPQAVILIKKHCNRHGYLFDLSRWLKTKNLSERQIVGALKVLAALGLFPSERVPDITPSREEIVEEAIKKTA